MLRTIDQFFKCQDWVDASPLRVPASQGEGAKWGKFLMIGTFHKQLAKDVAILKSADGNFAEFVKALSPSNQKEWSHSKWLESSNQMTEYEIQCATGEKC